MIQSSLAGISVLNLAKSSSPFYVIVMNQKKLMRCGSIYPLSEKFLENAVQEENLNSARRVRKPSMISKTSMSVLWKRDLQSQVMKSVLLRWN